jgi:uncharacterized membrane protein YdjX (TVP38/TMEM64 family)
MPLPSFASRALLVGYLALCISAKCCYRVEAFSKPLPRTVFRRCSTVFGFPGGDDGNDGNDDTSGGWFFRPPIGGPALKTSSSAIEENATKSALDFSRISTITKPETKPVSDKGKTGSKGKIMTNAAKRSPLSPLDDMDDSSSPPFLDAKNPQSLFGLAAAVGLAAVIGISYSLGLTVEDFVHGAQTLVTDPSAFSQQLIEGVQSLGPTGVVYYALIYMIAEILAVPATPLTLSAGYLFGLQNGILTVLVGATGAACVGFWISRTFLRDYVESTLLAPAPDGSSPNTLAKVDKAIASEGLKLLILIRLSPIFPFSVTNYLYGASSIDFGSYLMGTLIGFIPTTTAYVYTGMVGQALTAGSGMDQPWYVYAGGFAVLTLLVKLVTDVATGIIETIEED